MDVCDSGHVFPFLKQLTFYRKEAFDLNAFYKRENPQALIGIVGVFRHIMSHYLPRAEIAYHIYYTAYAYECLLYCFYAD